MNLVVAQLHSVKQSTFEPSYATLIRGVNELLNHERTLTRAERLTDSGGLEVSLGPLLGIPGVGKSPAVCRAGDNLPGSRAHFCRLLLFFARTIR